jgi:hypothetical protein
MVARGINAEREPNLTRKYQSAWMTAFKEGTHQFFGSRLRISWQLLDSTVAGGPGNIADLVAKQPDLGRLPGSIRSYMGTNFPDVRIPETIHLTKSAVLVSDLEGDFMGSLQTIRAAPEYYSKGCWFDSLSVAGSGSNGQREIWYCQLRLLFILGNHNWPLSGGTRMHLKPNRMRSCSMAASPLNGQGMQADRIGMT